MRFQVAVDRGRVHREEFIEDVWGGACCDFPQFPEPDQSVEGVVHNWGQVLPRGLPGQSPDFLKDNERVVGILPWPTLPGLLGSGALPDKRGSDRSTCVVTGPPGGFDQGVKQTSVRHARTFPDLLDESSRALPISKVF